MSRTTVLSLEVLTSPLFVCRDHSTPPLLGGEHCTGSLGFRWSNADIFGSLARGANCTNVHLERLIAGVKRVGLDVHDISGASGSADVLGYEVSPANSYCGGTGKRIARIRSVARTVSSRRRISGRAMYLVSDESSWCSAIVVLSPTSSSRGRLFWCQGSHGQPCAWNREHAGEVYVSSETIGVCAGLECLHLLGCVRRRRVRGS